VLNDVGNANQEIGIRREGEALHGHLIAAITPYRQALTVYTREQFPEAWAMTQNNLGNALPQQGVHTNSEADRRLIAKAVVAYENALKVYSQEQFPEPHALTQDSLRTARRHQAIRLNVLGNSLRQQALRIRGETSRLLLARAVDAYRDALRGFPASDPGWAIIQNNLAITQNSLG
jgi:tetratricopeptide (TPR) repeat protein